MQLEPGALINPRIRLARPLREGGMGSVWVADHLTLGTQVAVKFMNMKPAAEDSEDAERFQREAQAAAQIKSPYVVHMLDHGHTDDGTPYIVMEMLDGSNLGDWLALHDTLTPVDAALIVGQVARALHAAHRMGIIHRDIKPENIILLDDEDSYDGEGSLVKVLDFGVAHMREQSSGITQPGFVIGTPEFMCPDQVLEQKEVDEHTDMWALGVLAYLMLTGETPFTGGTLAQLLGALAMGEYEAATSLRPELPAGIDGFFEHALSNDREDRFESVLALADAFRDAVFEAELAASSRKPMPTSRDPEPAKKALEEPPPVPPADSRPTAAAAVSETAETARQPLAEAADDTEPRREAEEPAAASVATRERKRERRLPRALIAAVAAGVTLAVIVAVVIAVGGDETEATRTTRSAKPVTAKYALVPSGSAAVGCDPIAASACPESAWPPHRVTTKAFHIDRTEVTVADYRRCVEANACNIEGLAFDDFKCNWAQTGRDEHPINCVSWHQADAFCRWARRALPTEQQWERAALHREGAPYPWGKDEPTCGMVVMATDKGLGCGRGLTWHVGTRPHAASRYGLDDMAGNVREWVANAYEKPTKKRLPARKKGKDIRVVRGGGWRDDAKQQHVATRWSMAATERAIDVGFRCVRELR